MKVKKFAKRHQPLLWAILGAILTLLIVIFWAQDAISALGTPEETAIPYDLIIEPAVAPSQTIELVAKPLTAKPNVIFTKASGPSKAPEVTSSASPTPVVLDPRYGFTKEEIYLMSVLLSGSKYVDGDGEYDIDYGNEDNYDQIYLVLCVVMNRVRSEKFPDTVSEVIWASGQFSVMPQWKNGLPKVSCTTWKRVAAWCKAYDAYDFDIQTIPEDHLFFSGNGTINTSR